MKKGTFEIYKRVEGRLKVLDRITGKKRAGSVYEKVDGWMSANIGIWSPRKACWVLTDLKSGYRIGVRDTKAKAEQSARYLEAYASLLLERDVKDRGARDWLNEMRQYVRAAGLIG